MLAGVVVFWLALCWSSCVRCLLKNSVRICNDVAAWPNG